ncbi:MAG: TIGR00266 family protein [Pirellulaceae bacterium]
MKHEILGNPDYGQLSVELGPGESFISEGGAMAWMSDRMELESRMMGGFIKSIIRKFAGGESAFLVQYSHPTGGSVTFSPATPGTVLHRQLNGDSLILTKGAFLGCTSDINLSVKFGGWKSLFSGEGAFQVVCSGTGDLFFNAYGAVLEKEVNGELTVDTSHVVAWEPTLDYRIGGMGGLKSTLLSGEGLVLNFSGTGKIYLQTRTLGGLAGWLSPYLH